MEIRQKHFCIPKQGYFAEMQLFQLESEVTAFFHEYRFYLSR